MNTRYPTIEEPATPEYVLAVLQDMHRQQCQYDSDAEPDVVLSFETSIAEWRDACDLLEWRGLGRAHNEVFASLVQTVNGKMSWSQPRQCGSVTSASSSPGLPINPGYGRLDCLAAHAQPPAHS